MKRLSVKQAYLLGRAAAVDVIPEGDLRGGPLFAVAAGMHSKGLLNFGNWVGVGEGWKLSIYGQAIIRVVEGRECEWCGNAAVDARQTARAGCFVFFCERCRATAEAAAEIPTSEHGSLYGLIRTGRIKPRQTDGEAA